MGKVFIVGVLLTDGLKKNHPDGITINEMINRTCKGEEVWWHVPLRACNCSDLPDVSCKVKIDDFHFAATGQHHISQSKNNSDEGARLFEEVGFS